MQGSGTWITGEITRYCGPIHEREIKVILKNMQIAPDKLIAVATLLLCLSGCDAPELMPWHTQILESEYGDGTSKDIHSLEDYLTLEDAVFSELDQRIYAHSRTGPKEALERYSRGSMSDPQQRQPNWNRSFELPGDSHSGGVLLLHGMSDSPYSLRALGETLQQRGYHVLGLRMPGHGTIPSGMLELKWEDMAAVVKLGMVHLAKTVVDKPVYIIGYSTGAALALDYTLQSQNDAALKVPESIVLISPAIGVSPAAALAKWSRRLSLLPGLHQLAWLEIEPEFDPYKYNSFASNAAEQVYELTQSVANRIASRKDSDKPLPPILALKSTVDATVSNDAVVDRLLLKLAPNRHELVVFDINRFAASTILLKKDPGPFTKRLIADKQLPFAVTLVANAQADSRSVISYYKAPFGAGASRTEPLDHSWPPGVFSLSHVALPFPPDDPLYGRERPEGRGEIFLGQQAMQGERGVLKISGDFLLRLRHNPFYDYMQTRILNWLQ